MSKWRQEPRRKHMEINIFLEALYRHYQKSNTEDALDLVCITFDELLYSNNLRFCDKILQKIDLAKINCSVALGILINTRCVRNKLNNRKTFYTKVWKKFTNEGYSNARTKNILKGLD